MLNSVPGCHIRGTERSIRCGKPERWSGGSSARGQLSVTLRPDQVEARSPDASACTGTGDAAGTLGLGDDAHSLEQGAGASRRRGLFDLIVRPPIVSQRLADIDGGNKGTFKTSAADPCQELGPHGAQANSSPRRGTADFTLDPQPFERRSLPKRYQRPVAADQLQLDGGQFTDV
jgi:hypothetical protein